MTFLPKGASRVLLLALAGACLGVLALHPVTMVVYWLEFHQELPGEPNGIWRFLVGRVLRSFTPAMLPMSGLFAFLGGAGGLALAAFQQALIKRERAARRLRQEFGRDLPLIIAGGESENVEFKTSLRWDHEKKSVNRALLAVGVRTIAGFLNGEGGSLVLGVSDRGKTVGLEPDYQSLRRPDRDGYEQFVMAAVKKRLGGDLCPLVHLAFTRIDERELCRVVIERSPRPAYVEEDGAARLFLRIGNSTRRLDVREAVDYVAQRWPGRAGERQRNGLGALS